MDRPESRPVSKGPCPKCGSRDNNVTYDDGHEHCFSQGCDHHTGPDGEASGSSTGRKRVADLITGEFRPLSKRGISEETCRKFGYQWGTLGGKTVQIAPYFDAAGTMVAQKIRFPNKDFTILGEPKRMTLFGQNLWKPGGKSVVVTEGEIDAMSVSQARGNSWPTVSIPSGAGGAVRAVKTSIEWLETFQQVIFMFDMDQPGREAAAECAALLSPGKAHIAELPMKDPNELLVAGKTDAIVSAYFQARVYRPDGIVSGADISLESLKAACPIGYDLPDPILNAMIGGLREGELTMLTAGSGIGKSTKAREWAYHLHQVHGLTIGNVYLEEKKEKTAQAYVAIHNDVPLGALRRDPSIISDDRWAQSLRDVVHERMHFYDHFGSLDSDVLLSKIRYMRVALGCHFVILDHISIVVSGSEGSGEGERRDIDKLLTKLRSLIEQTGVGIIAITHLKQPEGKPHEEGGRVTLSQLRGSGSLKQLSDNVIALERNQQGKSKNISQVRVLKCREWGDTGEADLVEYDRQTGRLKPLPPGEEPAEQDEDEFA